jgi:uncharacterized protein YbjT (DUF2867 family)
MEKTYIKNTVNKKGALFMGNRTALVVGATGFVGKQVVHMLLNNETYKSVTVLVRQSLQVQDKKLNEHIINFNTLEEYHNLSQVTDVYCCLGTTIKKAKSKEAFKKVDLEYPLEIAKMAKENNVEKFLVISAMGADVNSRFFYNKVKGELEEGLRKLNLNSLSIFRPSLLLGEREEFRFGEKVGAIAMNALNFLLIGPLKTYRGIKGKQVAKAMVSVATSNHVDKVTIFSSEQIQKID